MPVKMVCPNPKCDASYTVADENLGRLGRCKKCGTKFPLVPGTRIEAAPSSSWTDLDSISKRVEDPPSSSQTDLDSISKRAEAVLPDSFGRYKVLRLLGRGGMGSVYLALDTHLKRQVALKVPHITAFGDRPDVRERFFREAQAAARFHHPNFCPIHDIGEVDGVPYLTMAFIEGKTLAASIEWGSGWPPRRAVEVTRELALALAKAHHEGIIHRDLKPANVMVDTSGGLVLMDFGLARWHDDLDSTFTPSGAVLGTPAYMPPEQAEGNLKAIGPRSDLYSLGVILYELLTGRRPFEGSLTKVLGMIAFVAPPPPSTHRPDLDPRLEAICLKALAKKPEDRHDSMNAFAKDLETWLEGSQTPNGGSRPVVEAIVIPDTEVAQSLVKKIEPDPPLLSEQVPNEESKQEPIMGRKAFASMEPLPPPKVKRPSNVTSISDESSLAKRSSNKTKQAIIIFACLAVSASMIIVTQLRLIDSVSHNSENGPEKRKLVPENPPQETPVPVSPPSRESLLEYCKNNLKQVGLGLLKYERANGCFPPAVLYGADGQTPYSWRVAILPFMNESELYSQYKFDEAWDGPNNAQLIAKIPAPYWRPESRDDKILGITHYLAPIGAHTMFPEGRKISRSSITDGTSNSLMIIEAKRGVPWTKPEDLTIGNDHPINVDVVLDSIGESHSNVVSDNIGESRDAGFHVLFADGKVRFIKNGIDKNVFGILLTIHGGELFSVNSLD
jgi:serine/threonine protein kinase